MGFVRKGNLPRLARHHYQGHAIVFWTNTVEGRAQGWLNDRFHWAFREISLHAAARYDVWCPCYCLMPDHVHLVWMGMSRASDQCVAMQFVRGELQPFLGAGVEWQHQSYDRVLREEERRRDAFVLTCHYMLENPVRAGLAATARQWSFKGAIVPGYPRLDPHDERYWELFWRLSIQAKEEAERVG